MANLNHLAAEICKREGLKKQVNIAQVKEVLRVLIEILEEHEFDIAAFHVGSLNKELKTISPFKEKKTVKKRATKKK